MEDIYIERISVRAVNTPLEYPVHTAVGVVKTSPLVLIDIFTNTEIVGKSYIFAYSPIVLESLKQLTESLSKMIIGFNIEPISIDSLFEEKFKLVGYTGLLRMAGSGIDMALWDALAKSVELPLYKLLGGPKSPIQTYDSHSMDGLSLAAKRAEKAYKDGFTAVKTKIGYPELKDDLAVIQKIREATDSSCKIMVDYNQGLTVPESISRIKSLEDEGVYWVEEPVSYFDNESFSQIRNNVSVPIMIGENWLGIHEMVNSLKLKANDYAMPDVMKIGGVTGWIKAAALAESFSIPMSSHLFQEFSAHLLCVTPTSHWLEKLDIAHAIIDSSLIFVDGEAIVSDEVGAGFEWKEPEIAKYLI